MVNLIVSGAAGRMGARIITLANDHREIHIVGALEHKDHPKIGSDIGETAGIGGIGLAISADINDIREKADVLIDFSNPETAVHMTDAAASKGMAMVIGTTGFSKDDLKEIESLTKNIPCVMASNMSLGINLLLKVL